MMLAELDLIVLDYLDIPFLVSARYTCRSWYEYVWKLSRRNLPLFLSLLPDEQREEFYITWDDVLRCYGKLHLEVEERYKSYLTVEFRYEYAYSFELEEHPWVACETRITAFLDTSFQDSDSDYDSDSEFRISYVNEIQPKNCNWVEVAIGDVLIFSYEQM